MFIQIVDTDDAFNWTPVHEESGKNYDSAFQLRLVTDDVDKELRAKHTRKVWDKHKHVDKLDDAAFIADVLNYAIVGWTGVKAASTGADLPCSTAMKARLPERWKAEILRLCAGKEGGEVISQAEQEKKALTSISSSSPTPVAV